MRGERQGHDGEMMECTFGWIADALGHLTRGEEICLLAFQGEVSHFCRFNRGRVRQAGHVHQLGASLTLVDGERQVSLKLRLTGEAALDRATLEAALERLRGYLQRVPEDPHLCFAREVRSSRQVDGTEPPDPLGITGDILDGACGHDFVGILATGSQYAGFANSLGQRNWHATGSFNLEWSLHAEGDKAVKRQYAGTMWDGAHFRAQLHDSAEQLQLMRRAPVALTPGEYRVYLAPSALAEVVRMLCWGGFSARAHQTKSSPLHRLAGGTASLSPLVSLAEDLAGGMAPSFQERGVIKPPRVELITAGRYGEPLVAPRSAAEYGMRTNGAEPDESPVSLEMAPGALPASEVLAQLGDGLYLNNLWYLNWSDRNSARITGMTRFASFLVKGGELQGPIQVLRFDDSVYRLLGSALEALSAERELIIDTASYEARSFRTMRLPGALIGAMRFTL